jgi:hypothetical protein
VRPHTEPGVGLELGGVREAQAARRGAGDDRTRERVLARLLDGSGERDELALVEACMRQCALKARPALGQRARLVDDDRRDALESLERRASDEPPGPAHRP